MSQEKTILIGRNPADSSLLIAVGAPGAWKQGAYGSPKSVPQSVSRCVPGDDAAHCVIDVLADGTMVISNLKTSNYTFVDGQKVEQKRLSGGNVVALGPDKYTLDVPAVVKRADEILQGINLVKTTAGKTPPPPAPTGSVSIAHLEKVWDEYDQGLLEIQKKQQEKGRKRMLPLMLGTLSSVIAAVMSQLVGAASLAVTLPISLLCFVFYFKMYNDKDTSVEDRKALQDKLIDEYRCPKCHKYLQANPYRLVSENPACPYCKVKWTK